MKFSCCYYPLQCNFDSRYYSNNHQNLSIKAWNLCLSVCVRVYSANISADQDQSDLRVSTWLLRGSRVCDFAFVWTAMMPLINYFINALPIPQAFTTGATTVTCTPEPITAEPTVTPHLKKQADLYLQWRQLDRDSAGSSVLFHSVHLN